MDSSWGRKFSNPGPEYRSAPFWSWNDRLSPEELRRQVREMKTHGVGGFFMHSRDGLETEYLGPEWMDCILQAVDEARKSRMCAFLYDEDRWPSGFAGGIVPAMGERNCQKVLVATFVKKSELDGSELRLYAVSADGGALRSSRDLTDAPKPTLKKGEKLLAFFQDITETRDWHNGYPYCDNLSAECVRDFIDCTYEAYYKLVGRHFGKTIPGIFTDEPHVGMHGGGAREGTLRRMSWTTVFADYFRKKRGYDFWELAPQLVFEGRQTRAIRHDYWLTLTELYVESFSRQLGRWCEEHNIALTGHYLFEDNLLMQISCEGAVMPHYEWQQMPGIDLLTENRIELLTAKQCSSVASQFGRKRVLSELYGCTGWDFTFEGMKWTGDWQYVLGINYRCPHLALYTLRGCAKRDYPPSFNYNTTWWEHNGVMEDYFGRLSAMLTEGEADRRVLLVHPIATGWMMHTGESASSQGVRELDDQLQAVMRLMLGNHFDFDFGDEILIRTHGRVQGKRFRIKRGAYDVVVLPPMQTLMDSTLDKLLEFLRAGGTVLAVEPVPGLVNARQSKRIGMLTKHKRFVRCKGLDELRSALEASAPAPVRVTDEYGKEVAPVWYHLRRAGRDRVLFLANTDRRNAYDAKVCIEGRGCLEEWDLLTGRRERVPAVSEGKCLVAHTRIEPSGSRLYVLDGSKKAVRAAPASAQRHVEEIHLGPKWSFRRTEPNAYPLDVCRFRLNDGAYSRPEPVWQAQRQVRRMLGLRPVYMNGGLQRWSWLAEKKDVKGAAVEMRFDFEVGDVPESEVFLVVEGARQFRIELNGEEVDSRPVGWWLDRSFDKVLLPGFINGINTLVLACDYRDEMQLEDCYLLGDFGVCATTMRITREPGELRSGDWCLQGYPFYPGGMVYEAEFETSARTTGRAIVELDYAGTTVAVEVNGKPAGSIPWPQANGLDIASFLKEGANRLCIEVVGSPRNLLGPLHDAVGKPPAVSCGNFRTEGRRYTAQYAIVPQGLTGQVRIRRFGR